MVRSFMLAQVRREKIIGLLEKEGSVKVNVLSQLFQVSIMTINRDLNLLEQEDALKRIFGGAIPAQHISIIQSWNRRLKTHPEEKTKIARKAVELIQSRDTIFLDGSTTCIFLAKEIHALKKVVVVTNSSAINNTLDGAAGITLITTGGKYHPENRTWVGPYAERLLKDINVDKAFISSDGIHLKRGVSESDIDDAAVKKAVIESARKVVLMADASKFDKVFLMKIADLSQIDILIADKKINRAIQAGQRKIRQAGKSKEKNRPERKIKIINV